MILTQKINFSPSHTYTLAFTSFRHKKGFLKRVEIAFFSEFLGRIMILLILYSLVLCTFKLHKRENFSSSYTLVSRLFFGIKLKCRSDKFPLANINKIEIKIFFSSFIHHTKSLFLLIDNEKFFLCFCRRFLSIFRYGDECLMVF